MLDLISESHRFMVRDLDVRFFCFLSILSELLCPAYPAPGVASN